MQERKFMEKHPANLEQYSGEEHRFVPVRDMLAAVVRRKLRAGHDLFPGIFGLAFEKRRIVEVLATGRGVILTGRYGVAKTDLAKHVLNLLNEACAVTPLFAVERCPIQEDPAILAAHRLGKKTGSQTAPCPICKHMLDTARDNCSHIALAHLPRLEEGKGFARVQGGGDVLPEEIVGTYNLLKLAQIGDPFDPRVFEPGKIGQANRGLLFVDEIGKLPETAQHALIQAAQEGIVTPSKSRQTFPVDFLLVATTNPRDEEYLCGAVRDRLVSISIPLVGLEDEMRIAGKEAAKLKPQVYIPQLFLRLMVETVRALRADDRLELGPRSCINAGLIARSSAMLEGRRVASFCDAKEGLYTAILGKAFFEDKADVERRIDGVFPDIGAYLKRHLAGIDLAEIVNIFRQTHGPGAAWSAAGLRSLPESAAVDACAAWCRMHESAGRTGFAAVMAEYLSAYEKGSACCGCRG
jgi:Mg-chelatase subunit ChlI